VPRSPHIDRPAPVGISKEMHNILHRAGDNWTTKWRKWIDEHPNATTKEGYQQGGTMRMSMA